MPPRRPRAAPALPDKLVEEILLRVPPDDPASLARAVLACRCWRGLVADPAFRRWRLALHGAVPPPMLGVVCDDCSSVRFVPTSSCLPPRAVHPGRRAFDARHGRVLLHILSRTYEDFIVWNPITDQLVELPKPPDFPGNSSTKATVLCAATATGACDHLDWHRGPFIVVMVGTNDDLEDVDIGSDPDCDYDWGALDEVDREDIMWNGFRRVPKDMFVCVYSSESGAWSEPTYAEHPHDIVDWQRSALVGNTLYFVLQKYNKILEYDLVTQKFSTTRLPCEQIMAERIELTATEDGRLGFARLEKSGELCLWSREEGNNEVARDGYSDVTGWTLCKVIDLNKLLPLDKSISLSYCSLVGFVECVLCRFCGHAKWVVCC